MSVFRATPSDSGSLTRAVRGAQVQLVHCGDFFSIICLRLELASVTRGIGRA